MPNNPIQLALQLQKKALLNVAAFSALINILMLAPAIYMLQVYDRVLTSANPYTLLMLTLIIVAVFFLLGFLEWIRSTVLIRISEEFDHVMHSKIFHASFSYQLASGKAFPSQAVSDLNQLRQFMTGSACFAFFDAPWAPLFLLVIYLFHPLLGLFALIGVIGLFILAYLNEVWSKKPLQASGRANNQSAQLINNYVPEIPQIFCEKMYVNTFTAGF